ncbi:MAG: AAA family ATPase [Desulfobacteraceae bacterium]
MYTSFFGFKENPFNLTPDPRYLFLSRYHKEALDHLLYGINERKGFIAITGGIGTGKTTLCRALLSHLHASTKSALILNSFISDMELLKSINQEFGIEVDSGAESKKDYIDKLNRFLLQNFSHGGKAVLLVDEAQNLSHTVLEQIRMLSNLETEREKLIQIVLVGQSELKELLAAPSLRQLNERIMVRYDLRPLDSTDIQAYVEHRLVVAGGRGDVRFTDGVYKNLYAYSKGNPRRINAVCDRALLIAYVKEKHTISKTMVAKAVEELHGELKTEPVVSDWSWKKFASSTLLLLLLMIVAAFAGWSLREYIPGISPVKEKPAPVRIIRPIEPPSKPPPKEIRIKKEPATLFLDDKASLTGLFRLFSSQMSGMEQNLDEVFYNLASFNVEPEYHLWFKKPFRIHLPDATETPSEGRRFLLIRQVTEEGAIAVDAEGEDRTVSRDFIVSHWGSRLSFFYPYENKDTYLVKGTDVPDVLAVQRSLKEIGYEVETTGIYDEATFQGVKKFQEDLGLKSDGIAGPRTRALLFQMAK